jgi:hypothetical protein
MRIKQEDLNKIAKKQIVELKILKSLKNEAKRVLGSSIDEEYSSLREAARSISDRISYLELSGKNIHSLSFKPSVMIKLSGVSLFEARELAAKTLPVRLITNLALDKNPVVRHEACKRAFLSVVKESLRRYPEDDILEEILQSRLSESDDQHLHIYDEKSLGDSGKTDDSLELSDVWYTRKAQQLIQDYDSVESNWVNKAVKNLCSGERSLSGLHIDAHKLKNEIESQLQEKEDEVLKRHGLSEQIDRQKNLQKKISEVKIPIIEESNDPVYHLLKKDLHGISFLKEASKVLCVKYSRPSKKFIFECKSSGISEPKFVPSSCTLPQGRIPSYDDEIALRMFCEAWEYIQPHASKHSLEWYSDQSKDGLIQFYIERK